MSTSEVKGLIILAQEAKRYVPAVGGLALALVTAAAVTRIFGGHDTPCINGFASANMDHETNRITVIASYQKDQVPSPESLIECALWAPDDADLDHNPLTSTVGKAADKLGMLEPVLAYMSDDAIVKRSPVAAEVVVKFPPQKVFEDVLEKRRQAWNEKVSNTIDIVWDGVAVLGALWLVLRARSFRRSLRG